MRNRIDKKANKQRRLIATNTNTANIATKLGIATHAHQTMSGAHLLSKSVDVFTSTYAYTDGLLAVIQHLTTLFVANSNADARFVPARLVAVLSQTRAANRLMGTANSVAWFASVCAEELPKATDGPAISMRNLNQIKGLSFEILRLPIGSLVDW